MSNPYTTTSTVRGDAVMTTMFRLLFEKQQHALYDPEKQAVNLSNLRACGDLRDVISSINFNSTTFCEVLCSVISEAIRPPPAVFCVDRNEIVHLPYLLRAMKKFNLHSSLRALSATNNHIASKDVVYELCQLKFPNLQELALVHNPLLRDDEFFDRIRQHLPQLLWVDTQCMEAPPLSLPWPLLAQPPGCSVLQFLQSFMRADVNALPDYFAPEVCFSMTLHDTAAWSVEAAHIASALPYHFGVLDDVRATRGHQLANNHNVAKERNASACFRGRTRACSKLVECIYPEGFDVFFDVHPCPHVAFASTSAGDIAVATVHGFIVWMSKECPNVVIKRRFARTCTLTSAIADGKLLVTNDMLTLFPVAGQGVLLDCKGEDDRLDRFSRRFVVPRSVVDVACSMSSNDKELCAILSDLNGVSLAVLEACAAIAGGDAKTAVMLGRLVRTQCMTPLEAWAAFESTDRDPQRFHELLSQANRSRSVAPLLQAVAAVGDRRRNDGREVHTVV